MATIRSLLRKGVNNLLARHDLQLVRVWEIAREREAIVDAHFSYSAWGEDRIISSWLMMSGIKADEIRYLDIGAAEPMRLSNTFALYRAGAHGVLVEPDPDQASILRSVRPRDTVLQVGCTDDGRRSGTLTRMTSRVFNAMSDKHAEFVVASSANWLPEQKQEIVDRVEVHLMSINEVIEKHLDGVAPHVVSIDVEGMDFGILGSLDLEKYKPRAICVEKHVSIDHFERLLYGHGYALVCSTPDNYVFFR